MSALAPQCSVTCLSVYLSEKTPFLKASGCEQKENFFEKSAAAAAAALFGEFGILICSRNSEMYPFK